MECVLLYYNTDTKKKARRKNKEDSQIFFWLEGSRREVFISVSIVLGVLLVALLYIETLQ